jgi:hypothetical protein
MALSVVGIRWVLLELGKNAARCQRQRRNRSGPRPVFVADPWRGLQNHPEGLQSGLFELASSMSQRMAAIVSSATQILLYSMRIPRVSGLGPAKAAAVRKWILMRTGSGAIFRIGGGWPPCKRAAGRVPAAARNDASSKRIKVSAPLSRGRSVMSHRLDHRPRHAPKSRQLEFLPDLRRPTSRQDPIRTEPSR